MQKEDSTVVDTRSLNQKIRDFEGLEQVWLFGYGSLIYRPGFSYLERRPAFIKGWERRFWQGSHDHRGTIAQPGRVATLIENPNAICHGMAFLITPEVFSYLDHRERNGYLRFCTPLYFSDGEESTEKALVYVATPENGAYLGPASELEIARHIALCHGGSGPNKDYLLNLHKALNELGTPDPHVESIAEHLLQYCA